jgi:DNA-binding CsgD family transcriptional regulator
MDWIIFAGGKSGAPRPFLLPLGTNVVGRSPKCHIVLNDPTVSRKHAKIVVSESSIQVIDLGSHNGTYVDEKRVDRCEFDGDRQIRFGSVTLSICLSRGDSRDLGSELSTEDGETSNHATVSNNPGRLLTQGQERVFQLLLKGLTEKGIAVDLEISHHTVHNHVKAIYRIFAVASRSELFARLLPKTADPKWSEGDA